MSANALPHWDLRTIAGVGDDAEATLVSELDRLSGDADAFSTAWRGRIAALSPAELREAIGVLEALYTRIHRPGAYASLAFSVATDDPKIQSLRTKVQERTTDVTNRLQFFDIEIKTAPDAVFSSWLASPELERHRHDLSRRRRFAPHTLSEPEEKLAATMSMTGARAWSRLYTEVTSAWRFPLEAGGETRERSLAEVRSLRSHPDRDVRRRATEALLTRFAESRQVLTFAVNTIYQAHRLEIGTRKYSHVIEPTALDDEIDPGIVEALMAAVEDAYPLAQRYYRIKARALGIDEFATHDLLSPWQQDEKKIPWADARASVLSAFETVSPRMSALAERFFSERRIDAAPRPGKRDGAFCAGLMPGVPPYVLVNYTGRIEDVSTLAHELGHGVHFALAQEAQTLFTYDPTTPMAETASVFGETVLIDKLLAEEHDPMVRRSILAARIEDAMATIMRQVAYTRYELHAHARCAQGVASPDELSALWSEQMSRLYGGSVRMSELDRWGWLTIPHLVHYRFYCYSYAFGMLLVLALYRRWKTQGDAFVPAYLELLRAGGSDAPEALLAPLGIDVRDPAFWRQGLELIGQSIDQFEALV